MFFVHSEYHLPYRGFWGCDCDGNVDVELQLKMTRYHGVFLDAYGRRDVDEEGLAYFTKMIQLTE